MVNTNIINRLMKNCDGVRDRFDILCELVQSISTGLELEYTQVDNEIKNNDLDCNEWNVNYHLSQGICRRSIKGTEKCQLIIQLSRVFTYNALCFNRIGRLAKVAVSSARARSELKRRI